MCVGREIIMRLFLLDFTGRCGASLDALCISNASSIISRLPECILSNHVHRDTHSGTPGCLPIYLQMNLLLSLWGKETSQRACRDIAAGSQLLLSSPAAWLFSLAPAELSPFTLFEHYLLLLSSQRSLNEELKAVQGSWSKPAKTF